MEFSEERMKSCCFTGHRPAKLAMTEEEARQWLEEQIDKAVSDGYRTFITGCAMGVDIWAGQAVLRKRNADPAIRLIAANPWPEMADRWGDPWREMHRELLRRADEVVTISSHYHRGVYAQRNYWMVDHSSRLIACYNGTPGGTRNTVLYAEKRGLEIVLYGAETGGSAEAVIRNG